MSIVCPRCGADMDVDFENLEARCPYCDHHEMLKIDIDKAVSDRERTKRELYRQREETYQKELDLQYKDKQHRRESFGSNLKVILTGIVLVIAIGIGLFMYLSRGKTEEAHVENGDSKIPISSSEISSEIEKGEQDADDLHMVFTDSLTDKTDFADSELYTFFVDSISGKDGFSLSYNSEKSELCITNHIEITSTIEDNGVNVKLNLDDFINDSDKYFNSTRYDCKKVFETIDDYTQSICKVSQLFRELLDESGFTDIDVLAKILSESDKEVVCIKNGKIEKNIFDDFKATYESAHSPDNIGSFEDSETYNSIVSILKDSAYQYEYDKENERLTFYYNTDPMSITIEGKKYSFDYFVDNREEYVNSGKYNITKILLGVEGYNNRLCELNQALRDLLDSDGYTNIDICIVLQTSNGETVTSIENGSVTYYMFGEK